jgi:hypothetical protein
MSNEISKLPRCQSRGPLAYTQREQSGRRLEDRAIAGSQGSSDALAATYFDKAMTTGR